MNRAISAPALVSAPPPPRSRDAVESAYATATFRALLSDGGAVVNPDYLARHFAGPKWSWFLQFPRLFRWYAEHRVPGACYYHLARTRHFDSELLAALARGDVTQLVLLGAGYDTRPHRFARELQGVTCYELDLPGTQAVKQARVAEVIPAPNRRVVYVPIDFQRDDLARELGRSGYDPGATTVFLWEGVSYFLTAGAVEKTLAFVAEQSGAGSTIIFDYALRAYVEGDHSYYGAAALARELARVGEPHLFGLDIDEIAPFLARFGLAMISDLGADELEDAYLRDNRRQSLGRPHGFNRIVCAESGAWRKPV